MYLFKNNVTIRKYLIKTIGDIMQQRLFEILYFLIAEKQTTASILAEKFDVSQRTIFRDIDRLSAAGIPIYTERGKQGGIRLLPNYIFNKAVFTENEQTEILSSMQGFKALTTFIDDNNSSLEKLSALFGKKEKWISVNFAPWQNQENSENLFLNLKNSILNHFILSFMYFSATSSSKIRTVEPYQLVFRNQNWYLYAFCLEKNEFRYFKLNRIKNIEISEKIFYARDFPTPESTYSPAQDFFTFIIEFNKELLPQIYDDFASANIQIISENTYTLSAHIPYGEWVVTYVLSLGSNAVVKEPIWLKNKIQKNIKEMAKNYF